MLDYDKVLESVGEIGTYQKRLCFFMFMMTFPNGILVPTTIFNNVTPGFRCAVPGLSNDSFAIRNEHHKALVQGTIPHDGEHYSHCEFYDLENATLTSASLTVSPVPEQINNFTSRIPCDRWVYDDTGHHTQVPDFDLVCDRVIYKAHGNTMLLMGLLVGSLIGGPVSDFIGRKKTVLMGTMSTICVGVGAAWVQSIYLVMALRFLLLAACSYSFLAAFVMLCETLGTSKRSMATMATMLGYSIGQYVCVLVHYLVEDWRTAQLVLSLPLLSFVGFWWVIHESPRWLLANRREKEARSIIERIAKVNKACLPQEMEIMNNADQLTSSRDENEVDDVTNSSGSKQMKIWAICADRKVAFRLVILCFSWTTINMVYYGLLLGVGDIIEGNIYINFLLQAVMETSAHLICIWILEKLDRKRIYCSAMILTGLSMLGIGAVNIIQISNTQWLPIIFYCIGKLCITTAFNLIYIITTELLPTRIRNSGLGFCSFVARFSGIVSPYIVSVSLLIPGPIGKSFPVLIFGTFSLLAGLSALLLPETRNVQLPETFQENNNSKSGSESQYHKCLEDDGS